VKFSTAGRHPGPASPLGMVAIRCRRLGKPIISHSLQQFLRPFHKAVGNGGNSLKRGLCDGFVR
jgi:hypothetical protein